MKRFIEVMFLYKKNLRRKLIRISDIIYVRERTVPGARIGISYTEGSVLKTFDLKKPSELWVETPYDEVIKQLEENTEEEWDDFTVGL